MITIEDGNYEIVADLSASKDFYVISLFVESERRRHEVWLTQDDARLLALDILKHVKLTGETAVGL